MLPIYKQDDQRKSENYRPITITPILSKVFEKALLVRFMRYLEHHDVLTKDQFGFRPALSTTDAILELVKFVCDAFEESQTTCGVYCDLSKAFDCVSHDILLRKLEQYGFRGVALDLIKSFLTNRKQQVSSNSTLSEIEIVNCGVAQGSVLGPFYLYCTPMTFP